ncbi:MAG: ABC transporter permease [Clostridia bacterium]|nr:ABC transporter permease [Clostridia bacterium]
MERVLEYLGRSLKTAWKTVFFNFKQYLCFFVAIVIVQLLFGMMAVSNDNNNDVEYARVTEQYDYHMAFMGVNEPQYAVLSQGANELFKSNIIYEIVRVEEYYDEIVLDRAFDVYIYFIKDDLNSCLKSFNINYGAKLDKLGDYVRFESPLMTFEDNIRANAWNFTLITLLLLVLCIFLLTSLYNIRLNQYKFQYGVYMTFGADFKMLFSTAFWELFVILVVSFIPSYAISTLISFLIFKGTGTAFVFNGLSILKVFLFSLIVIVASVWTPMKLLSIKDPMSLIVTEDNSNLVSSPWRSLSIFGEKFPTRYEFYSIWRFRKYNLQLLTTAIVFCAMFIMGLYMSEIYKTDLEYNRAQFEIDFGELGYTYDDDFSQELYAMEGVHAVKIGDNSSEALLSGSHIVVDKKDVLPLSGMIKDKGSTFRAGHGDSRVTNEVLYTAMTDEQIGILEDYNYTGDLSCLSKPGYIIVGDSISNVRKFDFQVGDIIRVAIKTGQVRAMESNLSGKLLLREQLKYFRYDYVDYTVGAVIHDIPSGSMPIFLSMEDYIAVTGETPKAEIVEVYVKPGSSIEKVNSLYSELREWSHYYGGIKVTNLDSTLENKISEDKHYNELYVAISLLILCISPLVWFFSQSLYYKKREREFNILQSVGAIGSEIRSIYIQGGLSMATLSLIVSVALSYLGSYALFYLYNVVMPSFTGENIRYIFYMPWYAIVTSVVMSVVCGFLSAYFPYRSYFKYRKSLQNGGAGGEYGGEE